MIRLKTPVILSFLSIMLLMSGCQFGPGIRGSKTIVETEYPFKDFSKIELSGVYKIELIQSDQYKVMVSYNDNLKNYLRIKKDGETLVFGLKKMVSVHNAKLTAKVYMPNLEGIKASGATRTSVEQFTCENLDLHFSGASGMKGNFDIRNLLSVNASGASTINLEGQTINSDIDLSGAAKLRGKDLVVKDKLMADCSGASAVTINSDGKMDLDLSGASAFNYYGSGVITDQKTTGASNVNKKR